jgi:hypothetical protein
MTPETEKLLVETLTELKSSAKDLRDNQQTISNELTDLHEATRKLDDRLDRIELAFGGHKENCATFREGFRRELDSLDDRTENTGNVWIQTARQDLKFWRKVAIGIAIAVLGGGTGAGASFVRELLVDSTSPPAVPSRSLPQKVAPAVESH